MPPNGVGNHKGLNLVMHKESDGTHEIPKVKRQLHQYTKETISPIPILKKPARAVTFQSLTCWLSTINSPKMNTQTSLTFYITNKFSEQDHLNDDNTTKSSAKIRNIELDAIAHHLSETGRMLMDVKTQQPVQ